MTGVVAELTGFWSTASADLDAVFGGRMFGAARWVHDEPEFPELEAPFHTFTVALAESDVVQRVGGRETPFTGPRGSVGFLSAGNIGRWLFRTPTRVTHVYLPVSVVSDVRRELFGRAGDVVALETRGRVEDPLLAGLAREVAASVGEAPPPRLYVDQIAQALAFRLVLAHEGRSPGAAPRGGLAPWQIRRLRDHIEAHVASDLALADLAALVDLSVFHFARAFRASLGAPPARYVTSVRLRHACRMLAQTDLPVADIGAAIGYADPQGFARAFRREHGVSPSAWRQNNSRQDDRRPDDAR